MEKILLHVYNLYKEGGFFMGITHLEEKMKNHRHNLHDLAELSHVEFKTAKYIRDYLDK